MRTKVDSSTRNASRRGFAATSAVAAIVLAACGGGSDSTASDDPVAAVDSAAPAESTGGEPAEVTSGPGHVDLVGPDVVGSAEIATNQLPSVVLDDVSTGQKVNFRNLVPQDKPILLWMYAPH
ncbi:hypothetical protein [Ilumatobacter nonamiensis]|uniref:hypothetical protein n=1 Tax=Ilumatobacter nonamiensis TaxID=467093 RepID=UPI0011D182B0|nr:hypothetical protein [Ilumatobacter nonamiensis]